jgi:hypothetical protein
LLIFLQLERTVKTTKQTFSTATATDRACHFNKEAGVLSGMHMNEDGSRNMEKIKKYHISLFTDEKQDEMT